MASGLNVFQRLILGNPPPPFFSSCIMSCFCVSPLNTRFRNERVQAALNFGNRNVKQQREEETLKKKVCWLTWERQSLLVGRWYCPSLCCRIENPLGCGLATLQAQEAKSSEREELCIWKKRQSISGQTSSSALRCVEKNPTARQRFWFRPVNGPVEIIYPQFIRLNPNLLSR